MPRRPSAATAATPHPLISDDTDPAPVRHPVSHRLLRQRNRLREAAAPLVAPEAIVTGTVTHLKDGDTVMPVAGDASPPWHAAMRCDACSGRSRLPGVLASAPTAEARFAIATGYAMARKGSSMSSSRSAARHRLTERARSLAVLCRPS